MDIVLQDTIATAGAGKSRACSMVAVSQIKGIPFLVGVRLVRKKEWGETRRKVADEGAAEQEPRARKRKSRRCADPCGERDDGTEDCVGKTWWIILRRTLVDGG
jgi:hypothetical protein